MIEATAHGPTEHTRIDPQNRRRTKTRDAVLTLKVIMASLIEIAQEHIRLDAPDFLAATAHQPIALNAGRTDQQRTCHSVEEQRRS
jgi:hypothetical protein